MAHRDTFISRLWNRFFGPHRVCFRCGERIKQRHRWHYVRRNFLFWVLEHTEHRNCANPHLTNVPHRLKGEVPLPFPEHEVTQ